MNQHIRNEKMLKQDATWHEIKAAWDNLTDDQKTVTTARFEALLKAHYPKTYAKLITKI